MTKTTVTVPANGGPVEAVSTIETVPYWTRSRRKTGKIFFFAMMHDVTLSCNFILQTRVLKIDLEPSG